MTELEFRNKVTWFSFALSLLVIWVHSYNAELFLGYQAATGMVYVLEHRIGDWLGQIAVPGFFMISGYRFYRDFDWGKLRGKWQRRIKSLLVPYIVWNFLYYLSYVIASRIPAVGDVVGKGVVEFSLTAVVDAVVAHTYNNVFWYLYQLLWLVLLALGLFFGLDLYFYYLWSAAGSWMGVVLFGLFAAATVIYLCTMLYVFPYALRRELPLLATVKNAFYIGMRHLPVTLLILAINIGLIVLCLNFAVLFAALPGVMGWADALCMRRLLNRYAPPPSEGEA